MEKSCNVEKKLIYVKMTEYFIYILSEIKKNKFLTV